MKEETIIITKKEYDLLIGIKADFIKSMEMHDEMMKLHDGVVRIFEEKCAIYEKALRR